MQQPESTLCIHLCCLPLSQQEVFPKVLGAVSIIAGTLLSVVVGFMPSCITVVRCGHVGFGMGVGAVFGWLLEERGGAGRGVSGLCFRGHVGGLFLSEDVGFGAGETF